MAGTFMMAEVNMPDLSKYETTDQKFDAVMNYIFLLLEYLRYALRNIGPDNMNEEEMTDWLNDLGLDIEADTIISNTIITDELYSEFGSIADLIVNQLKTDYKRVANYKLGNTGELNYIYIHDEQIEFWTDTVKAGAPTEQYHWGERYFWWRDAEHKTMTSERATEYGPVTVYQYDSKLKGAFRFKEYTYTEDAGGNPLDPPQVTKIPELVLGSGYGRTAQGHEDDGKAFIRKERNSFNMYMIGSTQKENGMFISDEYTDIAGLRRTVGLDFSGWDSGYFRETVEGLSQLYSYAVNFTAGVPTSIVYDDGVTLNITW